jgi:mRNA interferase MazF
MYLVVPLSRQAPHPVEPVHCRLPAGTYPFLDPRTDSWVKCDMVAAVSGRRLDRLWHVGRYVAPRVERADLEHIYTSVLHALGLADRQKNR